MIAASRTIRPRAPSSTACLPVIKDRTAATARRCLERGLHAATAASAPPLRYQPRLCLATGEIVANEALVRWSDHKLGWIPTATSISIAKQGDLIGVRLLIEACKEAANWNGARLSINVSVRQLHLGVLPLQLAAAFEQSGLPPDRLELELAEALLVDSSTETLLALSAVRDLGVGLALDDFGTGFASLSMLKRLPLTVVKLHRSLVRELPMDHEDAAIARAAVETGRAMRLTTVAEGIETEAQRAYLSGIGCDEGQGCLFSQPLPAGQLRPMLVGLAS